MDLKVYALLNAKIKELTGESIDLSKYYTKEEADAAITAKVAEIVADAPEDFDTLKEMSDWISQHEDSAAAMNSAIQQNATDISDLKSGKVDKVDGKSLISDSEITRLASVDNYDDTTIKQRVTTNETNILTLKKHVTGELTDSDFSEDSTVAMTKTVPTGMSNYAAIKVIGGKTVKDEENQVLKNAVVESVVSTSADGTTETTLLIPEAIKNLPDYGCSVSDTIYNWIDFENGVYHHVVGSVDMSNMVWTKNTAGTPLYYADTPTGAKVDCEAVCSKFTTVKNKAPEAAGQLRVHEPTYHKAYLYTGDNSMGRPEVAEYCKGVMLNYELATEELIDISDILHPIRCETGGTITLQNEHGLDMPNRIMYKKEVLLS